MSRRFFVLFFLLVLASCSMEKETNWGVNLDKNNKEPYGCYIARHCLPELFQTEEIANCSNPMKQVRESLEQETSNECMIITCSSFDLDSLGWEQLKEYVVNGNHVLICAFSLSKHMLQNLKLANPDYTIKHPNDEPPGLPNQTIRIENKQQVSSYQFKGLYIQTPFAADSGVAQNIHRWGSCGPDSNTNLITFHMQGSLTLCSTPLVMTNYFLLQQNNRAYFEQLLSSLPNNPYHVYWHSRLFHRGEGEDESEWAKLLRIPAIRYSFLILVGLLLCYLIFESKRKQRFVPILPPHTNTSLEFTETVGSLYFSNKNNYNLAVKMMLHYLEHLRSTYSLRTNVLDEAFAELLAVKINKPREEIKSFIAYLDYIRINTDVRDQDLVHLYHQIKKYS